MAWGKNGTSNTLASEQDDMDITDLSGLTFNQFLIHKLATGSGHVRVTFNNDGTSSYAGRDSYNGGTDSTKTSDASFRIDDNGGVDGFGVIKAIGISGEEQLAICHWISANTAGASNAPTRFESVFKLDTGGTITRIDLNNPSTGGYLANSNLSALGADVTEEPILGNNVQSGSRFEATDTRKIYYGALPSPDIDENFDSTGLLTWTDSDSAKITVDSSTNERLNFTFVRDSSTDETYHNLGSALSDTAWVMDFDLTLSTVNQGGGTDGNLGYIGIFSATGQSTQDGMHLQIISRSDYTRFRATASNNTTMLSEAISEGTAFTTVTPSETTYYVRIVRDGNDCTVKFYSTADRTGTPTESQTETQSGITALQYISVRNLNFSAGNSTNNNLVGYIDNLKVYDGVTSTTDLVWTEEV